MWFTVIRAYRVKTVSSYCETIPTWTSNYYDYYYYYFCLLFLPMMKRFYC